MGLTIYCGRCGKSYTEHGFDTHPCQRRVDDTDRTIGWTLVIIGLALAVIVLLSRYP
jgi:hypothetical protein